MISSNHNIHNSSQQTTKNVQLLHDICECLIINSSQSREDDIDMEMSSDMDKLRNYSIKLGYNVRI
jgi:hypothetical protein